MTMVTAVGATMVNGHARNDGVLLYIPSGSYNFGESFVPGMGVRSWLFVHTVLPLPKPNRGAA